MRTGFRRLNSRLLLPLRRPCALAALVLVALAAVPAVSDEPPAGGEIIPAPPPRWGPPEPLPPVPPISPWPGARGVLQGPAVSETATPLPVASGPADLNQRPLPINLATTLRLSGARPIMISAAEASERVAAAQLQQAQVLWLPNINIGASYYRHDGGAKATRERCSSMAAISSWPGWGQPPCLARPMPCLRRSPRGKCSGRGRSTCRRPATTRCSTWPRRFSICSKPAAAGRGPTTAWKNRGPWCKRYRGWHRAWCPTSK